MKILEIITFLGSGGAERLVVDLSNELSKNNDVVLMTILDNKKEPEIRNFYNFAINKNVNYINLGLPNGLKLSSQYLLKKAIEKVNPDIIHYHLIPTLKYSALALFLLAHKYKSYFTIHNDLRNGYDKGFMKFICNTLGRTEKIKFACLSQTNFNDFTKVYPKVRAKCIANGRAPITPTESFSTVKVEMQSYKSDKKSKLYIHIARLHPDKNQNLLIESFNTLIEQGFNVNLVIIGAGFETNNATHLRKKANNRIHFIGTRKNISDYILNADIFCLSSNFEGMPISLLEANLAGLPTVCTPVCGAIDIIKDKINGVLSKDHSLEEYVKALKYAYVNYDELHQNALNMRTNNPYTISECAQKYMDYFSE